MAQNTTEINCNINEKTTMANPENIQGQGFHTNPERINKAGYPKGQKNRSTILKELLALAREDGKTNEYSINEAIIIKAISGDVAAYKEIQDTIYGKIPDKVLTAETDAESLERDVTAETLRHVPTEELEKILQTDVTNGTENSNNNI
jgi:hypothetical protein